MRRAKPTLNAFTGLLAACAWLALAGSATGQVQLPTPEEVIEFLTYQTDRPGRAEYLMGLASGCPDEREDRVAAALLVSLGPSAVPRIQQAIVSIDTEGRQSPFATNSRWLLYSYAKIAGEAALPTLLKMLANRSLGNLGLDMDTSIAIALGLTSYVSAAHAPPALRMTDGRTFYCRTQEPRDALDQIIFAWESNDRSLLESALGPQARSVLDSLTQETLFPAARDAAVGYRFDVAGRWREPEEALESRSTALKSLEPAETVDISTLFTSRSGRRCGTRTVRFVRADHNGPSQARYSADTTDLEDLLRLVAACASAR